MRKGTRWPGHLLCLTDYKALPSFPQWMPDMALRPSTTYGRLLACPSISGVLSPSRKTLLPARISHHATDPARVVPVHAVAASVDTGQLPR